MMDTLVAIADAVQNAVNLIPSIEERGAVLCMGADGTPTSEIDKVAENAVLMYINSNNIPLNVLSEEIGFVDNGAADTLILDPIDGSRNAELGVPYYTISLAVTTGTMNDVHTAYLRNLATGDEYRAEKGKGAFYNGDRIHVKDGYDPENIIMMIYIGAHSNPTSYDVVKRVRATRSFGCTSLEMCLVAQGMADGFLVNIENYTHSIRVVDIAASALVLREAGGELYDLDGNVLDLPTNLTVRSNFLATSSKRVFDYITRGECSHDCVRKQTYGIYANCNIEGVADIARHVMSCLEDEKYIVDSELAALLGIEGQPLSEMVVDTVIVLGGDGTLLRATHNTSSKIVGINIGSVGFLTAVERDRIKEGVDRLRKGEYTVDRRGMIRVTCNGKILGDAINEAMIHTASVAKIRAFRVYIDDSLLTEVKADGYLMSTVTGSTSYSMSLGAPIMDPRVDNAWILTPMAAFRYSSRPLILPTTSKVTIEPTMQDKDCLLIIDGQSEIPIPGGTKIELTLSPKYTRLISMDFDFYDRVRNKLSGTI
ncbi:MAG: NAD(+)/NADH kinase [Candidatus Methanomethylophilaceae archaeon]|nr:NAD(+)/NADH kinase [Candidatus Methanomethylophilaceae archaeon]